MSKVDPRGHVSTIFAIGLAATAAPFLTDAASAQAGTEMTDPPAIEGQREAPPVRLQGAPATGPSEQTFKLDIEYVEGSIFNPATGRPDRVRLRSYTSPDAPHDGRFVAPAI